MDHLRQVAFLADLLHERLQARMASAHPWKQESASYDAYLAKHQGRVPTDGAFRYSRRELVQRGLLGPYPRWMFASRMLLGLLPEAVDDAIMRVSKSLRPKPAEPESIN